MAETTKKEKDPGEVVLKGVILSFPWVITPQEGKVDKDTGKKGADKYNCSLLVLKTDKEQLGKLKTARGKVTLAKYGAESKVPKYRPDKICYRDGDLEDWEGYAGKIYVSASATLDKPPKLVDRDKTELDKTEAAKRFYGGAVVNAVIRLWCQDNEHGKRLNAEIKALQFVKHGERCGAKPVDIDDVFDDISDQDFGDDIGGSDDDFGGDDDDLLGGGGGSSSSSDDDDLLG